MLFVFAVLPLVFLCGLYAFIRCRRKRGGRASWRDVLAGNVLFAGLLLSLFLLGGEIYYRFIFDSTDSLLYTLVCQRWVKRYWKENSTGFRDDHDYLLKAKPGQRRVTFVGDSFTAGHGIKKMDDRFVNLIRKAHPDWDVQMLARPGYDTGDELRILAESVSKGYQVDQVVLVYCLNDIGDMLPEWPAASHRIYEEAKSGGWLVQNSFFLNIVRHRLKVMTDPYMKGYFPFVRDAYQGPIWERQADRLRALRDLVREHGGQLAVVTFPFLHALGPGYEYQFVHDELGQFWHDAGVPHLDLLPVYKEMKPAGITVNSFDAHPNEKANALAGAAIDQFLTGLMKDKQK